MNLLKLILLLISLNAVNIQFAFSETPPINRQTPTSTPHESEALNADNIERWLQSQQAFEAWGEKHSETLESSSKQSTEPENPMEMTIDSLIEPLKSAGLYASANQVTSKYGFTNLESWANITLRITKAAAAIEFESHPEMMDSSRLEALKNTPGINEQQREALIQAIEKNRLIVKQIISGTDPLDKQAVQPFLERIHQLMEAPR